MIRSFLMLASVAIPLAAQSASSGAAPDTARERFAEVQRSVGFAILKPGRYRLRVTVAGGGATAVESAVLTVVKGS